jgi:thiol-disulfide isomerase/thioredoxin
MARTTSNMLPLGTKAPNFTLTDAVIGDKFSLEDVKGEKGTLIMFLSNHCPFVKHISAELTRIGNDYRNSGIGIAAIMSNDIENYPEDRP